MPKYFVLAYKISSAINGFALSSGSSGLIADTFKTNKDFSLIITACHFLFVAINRTNCVRRVGLSLGYGNENKEKILSRSKVKYPFGFYLLDFALHL